MSFKVEAYQRLRLSFLLFKTCPPTSELTMLTTRISALPMHTRTDSMLKDPLGFRRVSTFGMQFLLRYTQYTKWTE